MKTRILFFSFLALLSETTAQTPTFNWVKSMGGTSTSDWNQGNSIAVDNDGNIYTTGTFEGITDFDPSVDVYNLNSAAGGNLFIQKLDANGNFLWAKSCGGYSVGKTISLDIAGNIYVAGTFINTTDFDPGPGVFNLVGTGNRQTFILKLDPNGDFVWAKSLIPSSNSNYTEGSEALDVDTNGNVYLTGEFSGTTDFDPGLGTFNMTTPNTSSNTYILKLDLNGDFIWAKTLSNLSLVVGEALCVDPVGDLIIGGRFSSNIWGCDFDPGPNLVERYANANSVDAFILKLTNNGDFVWVKTFGSISSDNVSSLVTDNEGNVYSTGVFQNITDFDPGTGIYNLSPSSTYDAFIQKLDSHGDFLWANKISTSAISFLGRSIALDSSFKPYVTGNAAKNVFVAKWDENGIISWLTTFGGGTYSTICNSISVNNVGSVLTTGYFKGNTDFYPGSEVFSLTSTGDKDIFVHKLSQCSPTFGTDIQSACESYQWIDGNIYTVNNNTATYTLTNSQGCDSIVTLYLTINQPTSSFTIASACGEYTWNGTTYYDNGTYYWTGTNAVGCDSTAVLSLNLSYPNLSETYVTSCGSYVWNGATFTEGGVYQWYGFNMEGCDSTASLFLNILQPTSSSTNVSTCDNYTWNGTTYNTSGTYTWTGTNAAGCDSIATLNLTINNATTSFSTVATCSSYMWNGTTYNASGTYTWTGTNATGCDSMATLNLTINNLPNVSTSVSETTITANEANATYQWIDCATNSPISGANDQSYTATLNGSYSVIVTNSEGCSDSSDCVTINNVGIDELNDDLFEVYPNPTTGAISILTQFTPKTIELSNLQGEVIQLPDANSTLILTDYPDGIYFLKVDFENNRNQIKKIIINK